MTNQSEMEPKTSSSSAQAHDFAPPAGDKEPKEAAADRPSQEKPATPHLDKELEAMRQEVLRAHAKVENMRQRAQRDVEQARAYGSQKLVESLLPVTDGLDQALASFEEHDVPESLQAGVKMISDLMAQSLASMQVEVIEAEVGQPYNPDEHEAITIQPHDELPAKSIAQVVQKGYRMKDRVLRATKVIVVG